MTTSESRPRTDTRTHTPTDTPTDTLLDRARDMTGRTVLITGGTGGIGREAAARIARTGARVLVTGRDADRGQQAVDALRRDTGNEAVELLLADLETVDGARTLAAAVRATTSRLDVLIHNAGAITRRHTLTADGVERTLAVNHLAPTVLTLDLLPLLRATAALPAAGRPRVVAVTGGMPQMSQVRPGVEAGPDGYVALSVYNDAKLTAMVAVRELALRLDPLDVDLVVVYPGGADTAMTRSLSGDQVPWWMRPLVPLMSRMSFGAPVDASHSEVWAATATRVSAGEYRSAKVRTAAYPRRALDPATVRTVLTWTSAHLPADLEIPAAPGRPPGVD